MDILNIVIVNTPRISNQDLKLTMTKYTQNQGMTVSIVNSIPFMKGPKSTLAMPVIMFPTTVILYNHTRKPNTKAMSLKLRREPTA